MINRQRNATNRLAESVWKRKSNIAEPATSAETNNASYENDALKRQRNATNRLAESVWNRNNNTAAVPAVPSTKNNNSAPAAIPKRTYKPYDANTDYTTLINDAVKSGNYAKAAEYERLRNLKIGDMGLPYEVTDNFNYIDRNGYGGEADRLYNAIEQYNRDGFDYDYKSDPRYQQILAQQKKEAATQFENGLAELSQRFGGDVPANLIGGLLKTSQDTIDAADNYIPQLWQMAQDMWMNEGNQLYNQYNLASMRAADDYNKWAADRGFYTQGFENEYGRGIDERNFNEDVRRNNRDFEWTEKTDTRDFDEDVRRNNRDFEWTEKTDTRNFDEDVRRNNRDFEWTEKTDTRDFEEDVRRNNRDFDWAKNMALLNFAENAWRYNKEKGISGGIERPTIPTVTTPAPVTTPPATTTPQTNVVSPTNTTPAPVTTTPTTTTPPPATLTNEEEKAIAAAVAESEGMTPLQAEEFANSVVSQGEITENPPVLMPENEENASQGAEQVFAENVAQAINETPAEAAPEASYLSDLPAHWVSFFSKPRPKVSKTQEYVKKLLSEPTQAAEIVPEAAPATTAAAEPEYQVTDEEIKAMGDAMGDAMVNIIKKAIEAGFSEEEAYDVAASVVTETIAPANVPKSTSSSTQPKSTSSSTQPKSTDKTNETSGKVIIDADGNIIFKKK